MTFHGSYLPGDVELLLKPVRLEPTDVAEKERLIQSGQRHYSEMISREEPPTPEYLRYFHGAMERWKARLAREVILLARHLARARPEGPVIVSLARAGTPVGVLASRALRRLLGQAAPHYSISIIRGRGIDEAALRHILSRHPAHRVAFVDGWTGKGAITRELRQAVRGFNTREGACLDEGLYALSDLCGEAAFAPSADDYLIPPSLLGAPISGLISRTILNDSVIRPGDYHGCLYLEELADVDLSRWFVEQIDAEMGQLLADGSCEEAPRLRQAELRQRSAELLAQVRSRYGVRDDNLVKPGIGETARALLRRVPGLVLLRDPAEPDVTHLSYLARRKGARVEVDPSLPYQAVALIQEVRGC
jgi:hypothetical protein